MLLDDLITKLQELRSQHGNVLVGCNPYDGHPYGHPVNYVSCDVKFSEIRWVQEKNDYDRTVDSENPKWIFISAE